MRDLVLREGLKTMAGDASLLLRDRLSSGTEVPYEVIESGAGSALAQYVPQSSRFIREASSELASLDSFGTTCAALESTSLASAYLAEMGVPEPGDARKRAELAGVVFLCRLWQGSTDFTLDDVRLEITIDELLELGDAAPGEVEIAAPLRGFHMDSERLELAGATIVRADAADVPSDARTTDGMGGAAWEPTFLVVTRLEDVGASEDGSDLGVAAVAAFKRVITSLRLFKPGGVALGPHAWVKSGGDRWRRVATGSGRPRPGGYRLTDEELGDVAALSRGLANSTTPFSRIATASGGFPATLGRAISRFEAGLDRAVTLEALNDYLLSLRFLLEGGGPASLGMSMRVAALCAEPDDRVSVKEVIDRAIALERELWSGEPALGLESNPPREVAAEVEDLTRAILRDAACGHLGSELRITADEILLGDGLSIGEGSADRGGTAEWDVADPVGETLDDTGETGEDDPFETDLEQELETAMGERRSEPEVAATQEAGTEPVAGDQEAAPAVTKASGRFNRAQNLLHDLMDVEAEFEWSDPVPRAEREPAPDREPLPVSAGAPQSEPEEPVDNVRVLRPRTGDDPVGALIAASDDHRRQVATRVSFLFPPPETTEWSVREVGYDRTRRAEIDETR